jgi:hypothetical protein
LLFLFLILFLPFFLSVIWWRLWIYHGFPGTPGWWSSLAGWDGEAAYDGVFYEMYVVCLIITAVCCLFWRRRRVARS